MPYQLRHVDETVAIDDGQHVEQVPLEALYEIKSQLFWTNTRRFEVVVAICTALAIGAAAIGVRTGIIAFLLVLALSVGAYFAWADAASLRHLLSDMTSGRKAGALSRFRRARSKRAQSKRAQSKRAQSRKPDETDYVNYA